MDERHQGHSRLPRVGTVSIIEPSPHDAATAYVVVDNHRMDDLRPYLWKTTDYGQTWKRLGAGLPQDVYLHAVREDPVRRGLLYVGTERGVSYSTDDGVTFTELRLNLPTVAVHDLAVKGDDLVVGTHGRSIWIFGHLPVLRAFGGAIASKDLHLFPPAPATRWRMGERAWGAKGQGENPPRGALVHYFLKRKAEGEVTLEILDAKGTVVRKLTSKPEPRDVAGGRSRQRRGREALCAARRRGRECRGVGLEARGRHAHQEGPPR